MDTEVDKNDYFYYIVSRPLNEPYNQKIKLSVPLPLKKLFRNIRTLSSS